jgi:AcrR family transcriptional regulator
MKNKTDKSYHHPDLKKKLIEAGLDFLEERGTADFSLREVARKAGVSHTAPYRHFADRDVFFHSLSEYGFSLLISDGEKIINKIKKPQEHLIPMILNYIKMADERKALFQLMFSGKYLSEVSLNSYAQLSQAVTDCLKLKNSDEITEIATEVWAFIHGLAVLLSSVFLTDCGDTGNKNEIAKQMAERFLQRYEGI